MIKVAQKYGVAFNTLNPSTELKLQLPLFHHCGEDPEKTQINNSLACKCLRDKHAVSSVGQGIPLTTRLQDESHIPSKSCPCLACADDRASRGCKNPHLCAIAVEKRFRSYLNKWDPRTRAREIDG
ncbi:hypothetical protein B0H12DRAFT_999942, partial [Mycena haematopus]